MISYHITAAVLGLAVAATILFLVRRDHMRISYAYWWLLVAAMALLLGIFPKITDAIAPYLGIAYPPVLVLSCGIAAVLIKMLLMDLEHTRQEREIRRLTQRLAIYEERAERKQ